MNEGLKAAIKEAGGMRALGRMLGVHYQSIQRWKNVPAKHIVNIERLTGIPRERLRPDLYRQTFSKK